MSDREALNLHPEVKALQQQLAFTCLRERGDKTIFEEIYPPIRAINVGKFTDLVPELGDSWEDQVNR